MLKPDLVIVSADLDGIWDELGSLLLGHRGNIFKQNGDLKNRRKYCLYASVCVSLCNTIISAMP